MSIEFWVGVVFVLGLALGCFHVGRVYERAGHIEADLTKSDLVRVKQVEIIREIPKIVTKVVTQEVTVTKEVERVVTAAETMLGPDCVLPDGYGLLLVAAANGVDPTASERVDEFRGEYGCHEVLAATLQDLLAGWRNSARLNGLQEWARLVTTPAAASP